jgi:WD40 repeat protein
MPNTSRRRWTSSEKLLFLAPILFVAISGVVWHRQRHSAKWLAMPAGSSLYNWQFSPDSRKLLVIDDRKGAGKSPSGTGRVLYGAILETTDLLKEVELDIPPGDLSFRAAASWSPDGSRITVGYRDGSRTNIPIKSKYRSGFASVDNGKIALWDARSGQLLKQWLYAPPQEDSTASVRFSRDAKRLLGYGIPPAIFDAASGQRLRRLGPAPPPFSRGGFVMGDFSGDESSIAVASEGRRHFEVNDLQTGQVLWRPRVKFVLELAWSKENVLGMLDLANDSPRQKRLLLWDGNTKKPLADLPGVKVSTFALNDHGPLVAVTQERPPRPIPGDTVLETLSIWNYRTGQMTWKHEFGRSIRDLKWSPDGKWLALREDMTDGGKVWVFDTSGNLVYRKRGDDSVLSMLWSPDSKWLIAYSNKNSGIEMLPFG